MPDLLTAKALRETRAPIAHQIRELADVANDERRDFSAEEQEKWDTLNKVYDEYSVSIERAERAEKVISDQEAPNEPENRDERRSPKPGRSDVSHEPTREGTENRQDPSVPTEEDRALAFQAWLRRGAHREISARHQLAAQKCGVNPNAYEMEFKLRSDYRNVLREQRALSALNGPAGQYSIPEGFINSLERAMLHFGGMRQAASVFRTDSGNDTPWTTSNDTTNTGALIGENTAVTDADPTMGQVIFHAYQYTSKAVKIPSVLLEDSAFDLASEVGAMLGERIGRITNTHFTTGDGASKPHGIVPKSTAGKTAAATNAVTFDEILDLVHSVDVAYRTGAAFMMHDLILAAIRKLKDGNNNYIWQSGTQVGAPDTIWSYPYFINNDMQSSLATATKTMLFGQLSKYKIRDVNSIRLVRLNERYAELDQVGFIAWSRHDGNLLDAGVAPVKHLLMA